MAMSTTSTRPARETPTRTETEWWMEMKFTNGTDPNDPASS